MRSWGSTTRTAPQEAASGPAALQRSEEVSDTSNAFVHDGAVRPALFPVQDTSTFSDLSVAARGACVRLQAVIRRGRDRECTRERGGLRKPSSERTAELCVSVRTARGGVWPVAPCGARCGGLWGRHRPGACFFAVYVITVVNDC